MYLNVIARHDTERVKLQQALEVVQAEGLLSTVKVMCDWMRGQVPIISVCAQVEKEAGSPDLVTKWVRLSQICPIWGQSDPLWAQICQPDCINDKLYFLLYVKK